MSWTNVEINAHLATLIQKGLIRHCMMPGAGQTRSLGQAIEMLMRCIKNSRSMRATTKVPRKKIYRTESLQ
jgi:hypothetical protein